MNIILCADDFGLNAGVSLGLLKLVQRHRLSALSCMTNQPDFLLHAPQLVALNSDVQMGLHFNLTDGFFLSDKEKPCFGLNALLMKSHLNLLNLKRVALEFNAQLDVFEDVLGRLPDFIDGHQHVHQFPGIRQVVLDEYEKRLRPNGTYVRTTFPALSLKKYQYKIKILALTGGRALHSQLTALAIPHNRSFGGVYNFAKDVNYRDLFRQWLALASDKTLIMCHPGEGEMPEDAIGYARVKELAYFLSDDFLRDCEAFGVHLHAKRPGEVFVN